MEFIVLSENESISNNETAPDPAAVSDNDTGDNEDLIVGEDEQENHKDNIQNTYEYTIYNETPHEVIVSVNNEINPNDLVSVNSVSLNVISADGLSFNTVSLNVTNVSSSTIQVLSINEVPFWHKPFNEYSASEGILFTILITLVFGFVSNHLLRGLKHGNI